MYVIVSKLMRNIIYTNNTHVEDTTNKLLLVGWNLQHSVLAPGASSKTLTLFPVAESHNLQVPSDDADTIKSLEMDQSKSE